MEQSNEISRKKIYVSILISGHDYIEQKLKAHKVACKLSKDGWVCLTPFDIVQDATAPYERAMGACIEELMKCRKIYFCKGWQNSKGCQLEMQTALIYGLEILVE